MSGMELEEALKKAIQVECENIASCMKNEFAEKFRLEIDSAARRIITSFAIEILKTNDIRIGNQVLTISVVDRRKKS